MITKFIFNQKAVNSALLSIWIATADTLRVVQQSA